MSQTRVLVLLAGAALSIGAPALAQNASLDSGRAYAAELVNDSATRSSLLQGGGGGAGHDSNGFSIGDGSGNNQLYLGGAVQFRYQHNFRDEDAAGENNDFTHGFSNNNVRFWTWGHVWSKDLTYKIQFHHDETDGWNLEDAWGQYAFENGLAVRWGQFKAPVFREESIDSEKQLGIDRSNANEYFTQGYSQAVALVYTSDSFKVTGAFGDGASTANTDFNSDAEADYALTARVDFKIAGADWDRFNDFTSFRSQDDAGLIGAAVHWQDGGETGGTLDNEVLLYTIDATWEGPGYNLTGAFYGNTIETPGASQDNLGAMIQGGFFFNDQFEGFARYEGFFLDNTVFTNDEANFAFVGVNYYVLPETNAAKFTAQLGYALDDTDELFSTPQLSGSNNNGFLGQATDGEWAIQLQFQLVF